MEVTKTNSKFVIQNDNEYVTRDEYDDTESDDEDEINDRDDYEYVVRTIQSSLIYYVDKNYIPLCEYLSYDKIDKFISRDL